MPLNYIMSDYVVCNAAAPNALPLPCSTTNAIPFYRTHHNVTIMLENAIVPADPIVAAVIEIYGWIDETHAPVLVTILTVSSATVVSRCAVPIPTEILPYQWLYVRQNGGTVCKYMLVSSSNYSS